MKFPRHTSRIVLVIAVVAALVPLRVIADEDVPFDGPYLGLDVGWQNTIAGAAVAGVDTLAQGLRSVAVFSGGYRVQMIGGFVAGIEFGYGLTDGSLKLRDPARNLGIDYRNSTQISYGASFGYSWSTSMLFAYLGEVKRSFDVTIRGPLGTGRQSDKQGLLRYGLGMERHLSGPFSVRLTAGLSRADFGTRPTNIDPERKVDFACGVTFQF